MLIEDARVTKATAVIIDNLRSMVSSQRYAETNAISVAWYVMSMAPGRDVGEGVGFLPR
jgi:hypothetical protein